MTFNSEIGKIIIDLKICASDDLLLITHLSCAARPPKDVRARNHYPK